MPPVAIAVEIAAPRRRTNCRCMNVRNVFDLTRVVGDESR